MHIENILSTFEEQLRSFGLSDETGALLIHLSINGKTWLKSCGNLNNLGTNIITVENKPKFNNNFIDFMITEIQLATVGDNTKELHKNTAVLLNSFSPNIDIKDIDAAYLQKLELYMRNRNFAINTIARHMKTIKRYINVARKKEIITKYPFLNYTIRTEQTYREALTEKELALLEDYRNNLNEPDEVLNAFLFSCYTGLRYSDICMFTKKEIQSINRKKWIILRMQKTNNEIRIPLSTIFDGKALQISKSILRPRGLVFHLAGNQNANRVLRRIAKKVGIKKKITFHTASHYKFHFSL